MFELHLTNLHWLEDEFPEHNARLDLCLHGNATAIVGDEIFEYEANVSSSGLYLLKSLTQNHIIHQNSNLLFSCCGHCIYPDDTDKKSVHTIGCPYGIDWSVIHEDEKVKIITDSGKETIISLKEYKKSVHSFCDIIEDFFNKSEKKIPPSDKLNRKYYKLFWKEWHRRRGRK